MRPAGHPLPPTSSLPPVRRLHDVTEARILAALDNLFTIYYPAVVLPKSVLFKAANPYKLSDRFAPLTDSGYTSGYTSESEDEEDAEEEPDALEQLRADELERTFATRWLMRFIACAQDELPCFSSEETRQSTLERAADLLNELLNPRQDTEDDTPDAEDDSFCRDFTFVLPGDSDGSYKDYTPISIKVNDGLAGRDNSDHLDVGLQTWGASIVQCQMMCDDASRFGLTQKSLGSSPRIVELGAGTGLLSLVLAQLLPRLGVDRPLVVATDYHPSVIANLVDNIVLNYGAASDVVQACVLDWAESELAPTWPLGNEKADVLFATDVVYAAEHAGLLYSCASRLLAPKGVFWLMATVRQNARLNDVANAVEAVFESADRARDLAAGMRLTILDCDHLEKRSGVGRGDETFYKLFKIGWE
ncbi:putative methyltransferase-domain-containing protein [Coniochaeta sp. 2T2.1]|nr:putative methyltransferase-domain-containing protein [Coniochaeta sp. 2T2.1]